MSAHDEELAREFWKGWYDGAVDMTTSEDVASLVALIRRVRVEERGGGPSDNDHAPVRGPEEAGTSRRAHTFGPSGWGPCARCGITPSKYMYEGTGCVQPGERRELCASPIGETERGDKVFFYKPAPIEVPR